MLATWVILGTTIRTGSLPAAGRDQSIRAVGHVISIFNAYTPGTDWTQISPTMRLARFWGRSSMPPQRPS